MNRNPKEEFERDQSNHQRCATSSSSSSGDEMVSFGCKFQGPAAWRATICNKTRNVATGSLETCDGQLRVDSPLSTSPQSLSSPTAYRVQLFNTFLSSYIPSNILRQEREGSVHLMYFGFVEELARLQCRHPALITAMSALSLVSVGSMYKDQGLLQKSSEEYSLAVNRLANAMQRPGSLHDDEILASVMVLATAEFYQPFRQKSEGKGYNTHLIGLHSLLAARGPQPLNSRLASLVVAKAKASSIVKSMFSQKDDFYASAGWRELEFNLPSLDADYSYDLGIQMSRLFQRTRQLDLDNPSSLQNIDGLLLEAACIERDLKSHLDVHVVSDCTSTDLSISLEDIEHFPRFCELVTNRTLSTAHRFPSYTIAYHFTSFWVRNALLRTVVKTLQAKRCLLSTDELPTYVAGFGKPVTENELRHYVICLCRNIPFLASPACNSHGDICSFFPLSWASRYFEECKDATWSAWAEDVRQHLFVRGVSFPKMEGMKLPEILQSRVEIDETVASISSIADGMSIGATANTLVSGA